MRLAKRVLVFALAFLLLLGGIGISAALAAGAEREAAPQARAPFAGELAEATEAAAKPEGKKA